MFKTLEATIDAQNQIDWQEPPSIQGRCRVLITLLDEIVPPLIDKENFLKFLLDSPEMTDTEYQSIQEKRQHFNQWL